MRRVLGPLLALVVLIAAAIALTRYVTEEHNTAALVLFEVDGQVTVVGLDAGERTGISGDVLVADERVTTGGESRAVLVLGRDTRIRLGQRSSVQIKAVDEDEVSLELEGGLLLATVRPDSGAVRVSSKSRQILATDAEFTVGVGEDATFVVEATRGDVALQGVAEAAVVREGTRATMTSAGTAEIGLIPDALLLDVRWPEDRRTASKQAELSGRTAPGARVRLVSGASAVDVVADAFGDFSATIPLDGEGENTVSISAVDVLGNAVATEGVFTRKTSVGPIRSTTTYRDHNR